MISLLLTINLVGYLAGALTTLSLIPEIYKTWKKKEARDLSFHWLGMLCLGVAIWIVYGFEISSPPIIVANAVSLVLCVIQIILAIKYDKIKFNSYLA